MNKQLWAALMTWRRPIPAAIALLFAICLGIAAYLRDAPREAEPCYPRVEATYDEALTADALALLYWTDGREAVIERLRGVEELSINLSWTREASLTVRRGMYEGDILDPVPGGLVSLLRDCPDLKKLTLDRATARPEDLEAIAAITQLQQLSLVETVVVSRKEGPPFLAPLRSLRSLRQLDLTGFRGVTIPEEDRELSQLIDGEHRFQQWSLSEELNHLAALPALRTLSLFNARHIDGAVLRGLTKLPQVETLAIETFINPAVESVSPDDIRQLRSMPRLKTLYVPMKWNAPETFRALLPDVSIRRGRYDSERTSMPVVSLSILVLVLLVVAGELTFCALNSLTPVAPDCLSHHLRAAGIVTASAVLAATLFLSFGHVNVLSALALNSGFVSLAAFAAELAIPRLDDRQARPADFFLPLSGLAIFVVTFGGMLVPQWLDAWLAGDYPILACVILVTSLLAFRRVPSIVRRGAHHVAENGLGAVAGWQDFMQFQTARVQRRRQFLAGQINEKVPEHSNRFDPSDRLENVLKVLPADRFQRKLALLRAGNELGTVLTKGLLMGILFWVVVFSVAAVVLGTSGRMLGSMSILVIMIPFVLINDWRNRMTDRFELELLRPVTRTCMRRLFFQGFARDLLPAFLVMAAATASAACVIESLDAAIIVASLIISSGALSYGIGLWLILIRRNWLVAVIGIVCFFLWWPTIMFVLDLPLRLSWPFLIPPVVACVICAVTGLTAWRHWPKREMA